MIKLNGLLSKILFLVTIVAMLSLLVSYIFVSNQQEKRFQDSLKLIKRYHLSAAKLILDQQLKAQVLTAEELFTLGNLSNKTPEDVAIYLEGIWPRIQLSLALSSMSVSSHEKAFNIGNFPEKEISPLQERVFMSSQAKSALVCHSSCELASSVPIKQWDEKWILTLVSDINPSIDFIYKALESDIAVLAPNEAALENQSNLKRYTTRIMTGKEKLDGLFNLNLSSSQLKKVETEGLSLTFEGRGYFIWFETLDSIANDFQVMFIRDVTYLVSQQSQQKQHGIIILMIATLGILLTLIIFSIIPISKVNKLRSAIKLIATKKYREANSHLGGARKPKFNDELDELEDEIRNAIDMMESYEYELGMSQKKLKRQATIDTVTGLFTRNVLIDDLKEMRDINTSNNVAIFFLDLDGFKPVNDNLGHLAGDILLKKVGYRLKGISDKFTKVYRIGGDEFVISYTDYSDENSLFQIAESLITMFEAPFYVYETNIAITASIGIALQDANAIDPDQLLRYADIAMYQAKEDGKNRYRFFDKSMRAKTQLKFTIKNDFLNSLEDEQLFLVYQPIVDSKTRSVKKIEALCRWKHPELGFIPPLTFISVLEESENMNTLFEWIVSKVVQEVIYLTSIGLEDVLISINLSASQLVDDRAFEFLRKQLKENNIQAERIELEITETTLITNFNQAKHWLDIATAAGFRIAIDDFGAGYSSLSYLAAFNYNTVKLDRSLLDKIDVDTRQQRIVGSLTQMIHGLSIPIVAEGAETEEQFKQLGQLGCDLIQGYVISKPITHEELVLFLEEHPSSTI
jgi:diguanylate cyclase (GGDEF)-like protein